jgi:hypothetical protein
MKALYIHDQKEGALVLYGHDLDDQLVEALVAEYKAQGKLAFAVDQAGLHGGPAEVCEKCRQAGEKIAGGTVLVYKPSEEEDKATTLNGAIGMVSEETVASTSLLTKLGRPFRMMFRILPYLAALALIAYALVYFLHMESGQKGDYAPTQLAAAQLAPTQTATALTPTERPSPSATASPAPSPTILPTSSEAEPPPTELPTYSGGVACVDALSVTPDDAGKILCVTGEVYRAEKNKDGVFMITFSKEWGNFFLLSYNREWKDAQAGVCIQVTGKIEMLGTIPVIAFGYQNELSVCP